MQITPTPLIQVEVSRDVGVNNRIRYHHRLECLVRSIIGCSRSKGFTFFGIAESVAQIVTIFGLLIIISIAIIDV